MRYKRLLAMFVLAVTTGLGSAEAAVSGPPADVAAAEPKIEPALAPTALGSPCFGSMAMADRQEMAFSLDLFSMGSMGYAPIGPPGEDNSVLGLLCRIADFPIGRN
jgi:hypothetical protein